MNDIGMKNHIGLKDIYIAREIYSEGKNGLIRIDEEGAFLSFEQAQSFLAHLRVEGDYNIETSANDKYFKHQIIKYNTNDYNNWDKEVRWTYEINGKLLSEVDASAHETESENINIFNRFYKLGDIVRVKTYDEDTNSFLVESNFGVIGQVTVDKESWVASGERPDEWNNDYIVWLISSDKGILYHQHLDGTLIDSITEPLSEELAFLNLLSEYIKKEGCVADAKKIKRAFEGDVVVWKFQKYFWQD